MIKGTRGKHALDKAPSSSDALHALACVWIPQIIRNRVSFGSRPLLGLHLNHNEWPLAYESKESYS